MAGLISRSVKYHRYIKEFVLTRPTLTYFWLRYYGSQQNNKFSTPINEFQDHPNIKSYEDLHNFSIREPSAFWGKLASSRLEWFKTFDSVHECCMDSGDIRWFLNGKINVSVNCVDRHYLTDPNRIALIWEKDEPGTEEFVTYRQLYEDMNKMANLLKYHGVSKGDIVVIYMPASPMAVVSMLACARIGAVHSVVFAGFSADALASRINDAGAKIIITADQAIRGGKTINLKQTVDVAVKKCPRIKHVFISKRTGAETSKGKYDINLEEKLSYQSSECPPEILDSEDYLFMLYTSGSTGKPKGLVHTQAGYLLYASVTHKFAFNYSIGDVFGCVADIGWITGHSYVVYGPLSNGATTVLFESIPTYPDPGRYWEMVERLKINQFYGAPTALRLLLRFDDTWVKKYDRSSLKVLGCVGEPLNHEAWDWYFKVVGDQRCPVVDTWWQTETGGICLSPRPSSSDAVIKPGMPMRPFLGINPAIINDKGQVSEDNDVSGALCFTKPWPGMARTVYGDHQRFLDTYYNPYPGHYFSGDGAYRHPDGYYQITGRMDDVVNISGHRLGTAEIEDIMDEHPSVSETAVVGFPHEIKGESIYAFVTLKNNILTDDLDVKSQLKALVRNRLTSYAVPEKIQITAELPKTRSGKIMRRILRNIAAGKHKELGDISTLADPSVVATIIKGKIS